MNKKNRNSDEVPATEEKNKRVLIFTLKVLITVSMFIAAGLSLLFRVRDGEGRV